MSEPDRKFIIMTHIYNDVTFWIDTKKHSRTTENWNEKYYEDFGARYNHLLLKYKDAIHL